MAAVLSGPLGPSANKALPTGNNWQQRLTTKLLRASLSELAQVVGIDEPAACRMRANEKPLTLNQWAALLDHFGFKVVSKGVSCIPDDELRMLRRHYISTHGGNLDWGDPE